MDTLDFENPCLETMSMPIVSYIRLRTVPGSFSVLSDPAPLARLKVVCDYSVVLTVNPARSGMTMFVSETTGGLSGHRIYISGILL